MQAIIYSDGGARGNPGPAGIGAVIYNEKRQEIATVSRFIGKATNNQAEYEALIAILEKAKELKIKKAKVYLDSELIVKQINREYKVKDKDLAQLFIKVYNLMQFFEAINFSHVRREENKRADELANEAMDSEIH
jgi:ribonuclease HI